MERKILAAMVAKKLDDKVGAFIAEHRSAIEELKINPEQLKELLWELIGEAVALRQKHKTARIS